ncbi:MAG: protein kinase, partial [Gemmatimonadetes bacterium]|nr:protein kinase [Gemmatimonadota bacterium]
MPEIPISLQDALGDRYVLTREVGAGGMATVYLADDLRHGRQVAIKVLRQDVAEAVGSDRFLREIEIAASLTHPHVLPLHDSGEGAGFLYYVMPYIEGETLADRMAREGALPIPEALRLFRQIVDALGAAHERDIVHRDVKPANILLTGGHALVADFGIAKAVSQAAQEHRLTSVGVAMGTPLYMAPEQATANPSTDHRADLFAAGAVAYEMLTGRAPFDADNTRAILTALMTKTPKAPHVLREAVPERASDVVMRCLEKEVANRPQTAADLLERLDDAVTPPGGVLSGPMFRTRKARRTTMAVVAAVVAIGTATAWRWNGVRAEERWAREEALPEVLQLVGENRTAEAARLAFEAEAVIGSIPELEAVWPRMTTPYRITTDPPGADIQYRPYLGDEGWQPLGATPFESERFPVGAYRFRIELNGFETVEKVRSLLPENLLVELGNSGFDYLQDPSYVIDLTLDEERTLPDGMVSVPGGLYATVPLLGFGTIQPHFIPAYFLDRTEVTNEAYAEFVDTGGYEDPALWTTPMEREGVPLSLQDARGLFIDATGRPGPATWS